MLVFDCRMDAGPQSRRAAIRCREVGGWGQTFLPRGLETSCWMDADKQRLWHGGAANKHSSYHISFILCAAPSPPLALVLFGTSFMHICGCHRDLVLSVTARSTLIIHFRIFGILFFPPPSVSPAISVLLVT